MTVGVGVTTYNRPRFCEKAIKALVQQGGFDALYLYDDCSDDKYRAEYKRVRMPEGAWVGSAEVNGGVAAAKNALLTQMLADGHDWLILAEDDIKALSPLAVTGYVDACEKSGLHHLSFAHHGPANADRHILTDGPVSYYGGAVGAWCIYSRESLEKVGLFDPRFVNAFEHMEHTMRLADAGFMGEGGAWKFADATDSRDWLVEMPNSIERSAIRPRLDWHQNIANGHKYWREAHPETFYQLWPEGAM